MEYSKLNQIDSLIQMLLKSEKVEKRVLKVLQLISETLYDSREEYKSFVKQTKQQLMVYEDILEPQIKKHKSTEQKRQLDLKRQSLVEQLKKIEGELDITEDHLNSLDSKIVFDF